MVEIEEDFKRAFEKNAPGSTVGVAVDEAQAQRVEALITLVKGKSAKSLQNFLDSELKSLKLIRVEDERGYSLLHIAAFKKISADFESIVCAAIRKQNCSDEEFEEFVNRQTSNEDGYTALHLAAYHGNF